MNKIISIFSTLFGIGYSPIAPGTIGSIFSIIFLYFLIKFVSYIFLVIIFLIIFFTSLRLIKKYSILLKDHDSSTIVIDEFLGIFLIILFYDYLKFASEFFDYGSEVVSFTFEDMKLKLASFFENPNKYNQSLNSIRKKCFNISNETPKQLLDKELIEIYREQTKMF